MPISLLKELIPVMPASFWAEGGYASESRLFKLRHNIGRRSCLVWFGQLRSSRGPRPPVRSPALPSQFCTVVPKRSGSSEPFALLIPDAYKPKQSSDGFSIALPLRVRVLFSEIHFRPDGVRAKVQALLYPNWRTLFRK